MYRVYTSNDACRMGVESSAVPDYRYKYFLSDLFGDCCASAHVECETIEAGLAAAIKNHKCLFIATGGTAQQRFVTDFGDIRHAMLIQGCNLHSRRGEKKFQTSLILQGSPRKTALIRNSV